MKWMMGTLGREIEENLEDELEECKEELTKYKRAFEILKKFDCFGFYDVGEENGTLYEISTVDDTMTITKEEYELLEELMKQDD